MKFTIQERVDYSQVFVSSCHHPTKYKNKETIKIYPDLRCQLEGRYSWKMLLNPLLPNGAKTK